MLMMVMVMVMMMMMMWRRGGEGGGCGCGGWIVTLKREPTTVRWWEKKGSKTRPIFSRSCKVVQVLSTLGHCRPSPSWAPHNTRPIDPKNNMDSEDEGKIGKIQRTKRMKG
jgi:hypothetical protein